ncbi:hypothetical protein ABZY14_35310 [Streptomyces sp. NPDC006617]|uniref:hypothetical protein n=1 Tax=Streptomyces sp. NPDC006617 TaxID=3155354 RepID=UPI0033A4BFEB
MFGTGIGELNIGDRDAFVEDVRKALYASKVVAYAQGFDEIKAGSEVFGWNVDRRRWRASGAADASSAPGSSTVCAPCLRHRPELPSPLVAPYFATAIKSGERPRPARRGPARAGRLAPLTEQLRMVSGDQGSPIA